MTEWDFILLGALMILFISLIEETIDVEEQKEKFIDELYWKGQIIILGDPIIIETSREQVEGYFRGMIIGDKYWIFRLSRDGQPNLELDWYEINEVKKLHQVYPEKSR
ncbi:MAG: hypothetical protein ACOYJ1_02340 [Peptococcales bacterium]|jgi:hypothetical protein